MEVKDRDAGAGGQHRVQHDRRHRPHRRGQARRQRPRSSTRPATSGSTSPTRSSARPSGRSPSAWSISGSRRATRSPSSATPGPSGPTRTSGSSPPAAASVSIYQTNSAEESTTCSITPSRARSSWRIRSSWRRSARSRTTSPSSSIVIITDAEGDIGDAIPLADLRERGRGREDSEYDERVDLRGPRRRLPLHLHVRHDRSAEGLHPHARQLPRCDHDDPGAGHPVGRRARLPLPAAGARVRGADPVRLDRPRQHHRLLGEGPAEDHPQPHGGAADLLPVGAADLREDLHARHEQRGGPRAAAAGRGARNEGPADAGGRRGRAAGAAGGLRPGRARSSTRTCATSSAGASASA